MISNVAELAAELPRPWEPHLGSYIATGNVATRIRVHTAAPPAPRGGHSATGNTVAITQGGGARRFVHVQGWIQTSTATGEQMNASHIPIHR